MVAKGCEEAGDGYLWESCGDISRACKTYFDAGSSQMLVEEERRKRRAAGGATA